MDVISTLWIMSTWCGMYNVRDPSLASHDAIHTAKVPLRYQICLHQITPVLQSGVTNLACVKSIYSLVKHQIIILQVYPLWNQSGSRIGLGPPGTQSDLNIWIFSFILQFSFSIVSLEIWFRFIDSYFGDCSITYGIYYLFN